IRYNSSPDGTGYLFRYNENFPAFLLMSIIVALFMGLSVSAEEITRDRKILKRESFLHLSWNSYLLSKLVILFSLSALQTFTFVAIAHLLLQVEWKMLLPFWFTLFSVSCLGNVMGLNISSAFRSTVTVYIMIPLLLIPQMILSGLLFRFEKLNDVLGTRGKTPIIADMMASRWAYEAMAVYQFQNNSYEAPFYYFDKIASQANYKATYLSDELEKRWEFIEEHQGDNRDSISQLVRKNLGVIREAMLHEPYRVGFNASDLLTDWNLVEHTANEHTMKPYLGGYKKYYQDIHNRAVVSRESLITTMEAENGYDVTAEKNRYYNESLADLLTNVSEKNRIIEYEGKLVQQIDPVFQDPHPGHLIDYRAHLFAPRKNLLGVLVSTYGFNMFVIWLMTLVLYGTLYGKLLRKIVSSLGFRTRNTRIVK
ncbi:MAG: ABC transporter permease, partial [Bacteroidota bacterium]|nr:ABC transporter permease [Bacteroidota bacterium]